MAAVRHRPRSKPPRGEWVALRDVRRCRSNTEQVRTAVESAAVSHAETVAGNLHFEFAPSGLLWADDVENWRTRCRSPKISKLFVFTGNPARVRSATSAEAHVYIYISNPVFVPAGKTGQSHERKIGTGKANLSRSAMSFATRNED